MMTIDAGPAKEHPGMPEMVHLELSAADAETLREILEHKLHDMSTEINRTDSLAFKERLRQIEHALERVVQQLSRPT
jgi:hypothetical protein